MATRSLGALTLDLILQMGGFEEGMSKAERSTQKTARMVEQAGKRFDRLVESIDPVYAAEKRLAKQQEELNAALKAGMIDQSWYDDLTAKLHQQNKMMQGGATSTGQYTNALRMLPAQMTDVAVQLQGGQNPFTILLQQGSQVKDSFGGIGPAIGGVGKYVLGLVTPFSVSAAAVGGFTAAVLYADHQLGTFQRSLDTTNNYLDTNSVRLQQLAQDIGNQVGQYSTAADAVNQLATTGQYGFAEVADASSAVALANRATGESVDSLVQSYQQIGRDPVQALIDLNEQYHNVDPSQLQMVQRLEEIGDHQGAVEAAGQAWADSTKDMAQRILDNLGPVDRLLKGMQGTFGNLISSAAQWSKGQADNFWKLSAGYHQNADIDSRIYRLQHDSDRGRYGAIGASDEQSNQRELQMLYAFKNAQDYVTRSTESRGRAESDLAVAIAQQNQQNSASLSQLEKIDRQESKLAHDRAEAVALARQAGRELTAQEAAVFDQRQAQLEAQFNDQLNKPPKKTAKAKQYRDDAAVRQLQTLKEQESALRGQLDSNTRLTQQQQALLKFDQQIADLKEKKVLTADQKILLANQDSIRAQLKTNAALADQIEQKKQLRQLDTFDRQLNSGTDQLQQQYDGSLSTAYMGKRQREQFNTAIKLQQEYQQRSQRLQEQLNKGQISNDIYETETEHLKAAYDQRLQLTADFYAQQDQMRENWKNGLNEAFADYNEKATDIAGQTAQLVTGVMDNMTDAIVDGIRHGGISLETLGDIGNEVIDGVLKMLVQYGVQMAANAVLGETLGASATAASAAQAGLLATAWSPAAAMASLASFGGNAAPAIAGVTTTLATTHGLALAGMAHSGIDSVPEDGTWLLQKGERVTTAETSAKLDATLSRIDSGRRDGATQPKVNIYNNNGSRVRQQRTSSGDLAVMIDDDFEQGGPISQTMLNRMNTGRRLK
ncbi:hypothetical protein R84981_000985 [Carnimonas sp. R-84981]